MCDIKGLRGIYSAFAVLGLVASGSAAQASPIPANIVYSTSGSIDTGIFSSGSVIGSPVVGFQGIDGGSVVSPTPFQLGNFSYPFPAGYAADTPLGQFTIATPPAGESTTYKDALFLITFKVDSVNGDAAASNPKSFAVEGVLNGTVTGSGQSSLKAGFSTLSTGTPYLPEYGAGGFSASGFSYGLQIPVYQVSLQGGQSPVSAVIVTAPSIPEPGTIGIFLVLAVGFVGWRRPHERRSYQARATN